MSEKRVHVLLLAGGSGSRMGAGKNKVLLSIAGKTVLRRSAEAFIGFADQMIVVCRPEDQPQVEQTLLDPPLPFPIRLTPGGSTRQQSVSNGLALLRHCPDDIVLVHDGARCFVSAAVIQAVLSSVLAHGSGIPAIPVTDTIKLRNLDDTVAATLPRDQLRAVQTPQGFILGSLLAALSRAEADGFTGTDDASLLEHCGQPVHLTPGSPENIKLTTREDWKMAISKMQNLPPFRVGSGYDVHQLVPDRALILCGVTIPYELGLLGHSDADVALHALMDAMLGAAGLGDIGRHFPDSDPAYRGISSMKLLAETVRLLADRHFAVSNADVTIVAQKPKLAPFIDQMRKNVAAALSLPEDRVNIKATTTEHLGFEGRMEGISAQAVCIVHQQEA